MKRLGGGIVTGVATAVLLASSGVPATTLAATPGQEQEKTELELSKLRGEISKQHAEASKLPAEASKLGGEVAKLKGEASKLPAEVSKVKAEVTKLDGENGVVAEIGRFVPGVTALVAVIGVLLTLWKQIGESNRQRNLDREQSQHEHTQRFDEQFNKMVENLGSSKALTRAASTAQIETFLRPDYGEFHSQVFTLLLAAVRFPQKDVGDDLLAQAFQRAAREQIPLLRATEPGLHLDLSHCYLARIDLSGLDLNDVDIAFAELHQARFVGSSMCRARGREAKLDNAYLIGTNLTEARLAKASLKGAHFGKARLVSAQLRGADVTGASFQQASMQEVHLEQATLLGAHFEQANLNNAYFAGAKFDDGALHSILRAENWQKAHFDPEVRTELERRDMAAQQK
jgi:uncharacterized protein YjbI with pentapeptide repeats/cell division protein FtsB